MVFALLSNQVNRKEEGDKNWTAITTYAYFIHMQRISQECTQAHWLRRRSFE